MSSEEVRAQRRSECVQEAIIVGMQYGAVGLIGGVALVALASRASSTLRRLNVSAKTALVRHKLLVLDMTTVKKMT